MGKIASKACKNCQDCLSFLNIGKTKSLEYLELTEYKANKISSPDIVEDKGTADDSYVSNIEGLEFLDIYNQPLDENCEKMIDKEGFLVYGQDLDNGFLIKAAWESKFTAKEFLYYIRVIDERSKWDKNIQYIEEIQGDNENEYLTYAKFKKVIAISQRDMMITTNVIKKPDGILIISRSCNHEKFPEAEGTIRMNIFLAGYYLLNIPQGEFQTKVFSLTKANFGGSISQKFIRKATAMALPKLYQTMEKCMEKYYSINK